MNKSFQQHVSLLTHTRYSSGVESSASARARLRIRIPFISDSKIIQMSENERKTQTRAAGAQHQQGTRLVHRTRVRVHETCRRVPRTRKGGCQVCRKKERGNHGNGCHFNASLLLKRKLKHPKAKINLKQNFTVKQFNSLLLYKCSCVYYSILSSYYISKKFHIVKA